ncbi:hypothetical protein FRB95_012294, partial [Tulasnella sp. JGI-2019a]
RLRALKVNLDNGGNPYDNHQHQQEKKNLVTGAFTSAPATPAGDGDGLGPMDLLTSRGFLSKEEREKQMKAGACFKCGRKGHRVATCRVKAQVAVTAKEDCNEESSLDNKSEKKKKKVDF